LPALEAAFEAPERTSLERVQLLRAGQLVRGEAAVRALKRRWDYPDGAVCRQALLGLARLGYTATEQDHEAVLVRLHAERDRAAWLLAALEDVDGPAEAGPLCRALHIEVKRATDNLFLLLGFLYPGQGLGDIRLHLAAESPARRALAVEVIDHLLSRDLKKLVLPLVEDLPRRTCLQQLRPSSPEEALPRDQRVERLLEAGDRLSPWTRGCVAYYVGLTRLRQLRESVARWAEDADPLVRETARWAVGRLESPAEVGGGSCS
jgi:hypothetical protein